MWEKTEIQKGESFIWDHRVLETFTDLQETTQKLNGDKALSIQR